MMKKHLTCGMYVIGLTTNACAGIKCLIMSLVIFTVDITVVFAILESPFHTKLRHVFVLFYYGKTKTLIRRKYYIK